MDRFSIATSIEDGTMLITLLGELDSTTASQLRDMCRVAMTRGCASVIVDMEGVTFVDSSGLSALIGGYKQANGQFVVRAPSRPVVRLLQLTGQFDRFVQ